MNVVCLILLVLCVLLLCVAVSFLVELREATRQRDYWRDVALDECARADRAESALPPSTLDPRPSTVPQNG